MQNMPDGSLQKPFISEKLSAMHIPFVPVRYRAIAMGLTNHPDDHCVEMRILTDTGRPVSVMCDKDAIFSIQQNVIRSNPSHVGARAYRSSRFEETQPTAFMEMLNALQRLRAKARSGL